MLLAFDTGLRSVDIRALCLEDIDCKRDDEANGQKTRRIFKHLR